MAKVVNFEDVVRKKDELIPIEEWDGECWKTMFNTLAEMTPDKNPWDTFAVFMHGILTNKS